MLKGLRKLYNDMQTSIETEIWAMRVLERIRNGTFSEDSLVECKREISDHYKVARRIAGHCNAERGETVLWLIGVDERNGITGWSRPDMASLLPQIWSHFEGDAPVTNIVNITQGDVKLTALAFHSTRPPYIVKNPDHGTKGHVIDREIPWRDGTRIRTARREEVMMLLLEHSLAPQIEIFGGTAMKSRFRSVENPSPDGEIEVMVQLDFYVMPRSLNPIVIPHHRIVGSFSDVQRSVSVSDFQNYRFSTQENRNRLGSAFRGALSQRQVPQVVVRNESEPNVVNTSSELRINRAARIELNVQTKFPSSVWERENSFSIDFTLYAGPEKTPIRISADSIAKASNESS